MCVAAQAVIIGKENCISEHRIRLEVESQDVPDLTLIDLPGIARVPKEGQPEDLYDQVSIRIRSFVTLINFIIEVRWYVI